MRFADAQSELQLSTFLTSMPISTQTVLNSSAEMCRLSIEPQVHLTAMQRW